MAIKIFIDQGHNPQNPNSGAEYNGVLEQDINYDIGIRLYGLLSNDPNFDVRVSRPTAETSLGTSNSTSLMERTRLANEFGADWFISLHCNASDNENASGCESYVYSSGSKAAGLAVDITQSISKNLGIPDRGNFIRPSLYVLRKTLMPAVLVEMGYITNNTDRYLLTTEPQRFADAIYGGILEFFGL